MSYCLLKNNKEQGKLARSVPLLTCGGPFCFKFLKNSTCDGLDTVGGRSVCQAKVMFLTANPESHLGSLRIGFQVPTVMLTNDCD